jgi:hypothetical protein
MIDSAASASYANGFQSLMSFIESPVFTAGLRRLGLSRPSHDRRDRDHDDDRTCSREVSSDACASI